MWCTYGVCDVIALCKQVHWLHLHNPSLHNEQSVLGIYEIAVHLHQNTAYRRSHTVFTFIFTYYYSQQLFQRENGTRWISVIANSWAECYCIIILAYCPFPRSRIKCSSGSSCKECFFHKRRAACGDILLIHYIFIELIKEFHKTESDYHVFKKFNIPW